jgi:uncharacterized protein (TIGR02217 family)
MATDFIEERFPPLISRGAVGGLRWPLNRIRLQSGFVHRYPKADQPEGSWEVSHVARRHNAFEVVRNFWMITNGGAKGFRFKDWTDFKVTAATCALVAIDSTHSQLARRYGFGAETFDRTLQKIVANTFVPTGGSGLTLDYNTGILTHGSGSAPSAFRCEFDCPCIFGTDEMRGELIDRDHGEDETFIQGWSNIPIELIRV